MIKNRKYSYNYIIEKEYVAGIELRGTEVKSLRDGRANITESFIYIKDNECFLKNSYIDKQKNSPYLNHEETRERKLLLKKREIYDLHEYVKTSGYTIVPIEIFLSKNIFKIRIGVGKGKKNYDKRESIKTKDLKRSDDRLKKIK